MRAVDPAQRLLDDEEEAGKRVNAAAFFGSTSPEKSRRVLKAQSKTGLDHGIIERNLDDVETRIWREDFAPALAVHGPILRGWLAENPHHFAAVTTDLSKLNYLERQFSFISDQFNLGKVTTEMASLGEKAAFHGLTPAERTRLNDLKYTVHSALTHDDYEIGGTFGDIPAAIANQLPIKAKTYGSAAAGAAIGAGAGAIVGGVAGLGAAGVGAVPGGAVGATAGARLGFQAGVGLSAARMEFGLAYSQYEDMTDDNGKPLDKETIRGAALMVGAINGALEMVEAEQLIKTVPGLRSLGRESVKRALMSQTGRMAVQRWAKNVGAVAATEGVTEFLQSLVTSAGGVLSKAGADDGAPHDAETIVRDILSPQNLNQAVQEGIQGAKAGGGESAIIGSTSLAVDLRRARQAKQHAAVFRAIGDATSKAELTKALPEKMQEFVERATKDGPVEAVHAPVESWNDYWQSQNLDPAEVAREVTGNDQAYHEAVAAGHDIVIPTARYAVKIAATPHGDFFADEIRLAPSEMNAREGREVTARVETLDREAQQAVPAEPDAAAKVGETIATQLEAAGFDATTAAAYSRVYESTFRALGQRTGQDPAELFNRYGLSIQRTTGPDNTVQSVPLADVARTAGGKRRNVSVVTDEGLLDELDAIDDKEISAQSRAQYRNVTIEGTDRAEIVVPMATRKGTGPSMQAKALKNLEDFRRIRNEIDVELKVRGYSDEQIADMRIARRETREMQALERDESMTASDEALLPEWAQGADTSFNPEEFQQDERGRIRFGSASIKIELFRNADLSTFLHESAHFYLRVLDDLATSDNPAQSIVEDYGVILHWIGATDGDAPTREQHEIFARGFEAYLMEGKAPSSELRAVFARFRAWLLTVYRSLKSLDVALTPEVRAVFDRLVAAEDEIQSARHEQSAEPLFADPAAHGMSEREAESYRSSVEDAQHAAEEQLMSRMLRDVSREQTKQWKESRAAQRIEVAAEVNQDPAWRALSILQSGTLPDGAAVPEGMDAFKLDRAGVVAVLGGREIELRQLPRRIYTKDGGVHPDIAADVLGFASGDALLKALPPRGSETPRQHIERLTDERTRAEHGDLATNAEIPEAAMQALHSDKRALLLKKELEHLARNDLPALKGLIRKVTRRVPRIETVRDEADRIIRSKAVRDLRPDVYQRAEARAAKAALAALLRGEVELAFDEKSKELLNHELYRSAVTARETIDSLHDTITNLFKADSRLAESRDLDFVNAARSLAASYGLGRGEVEADDYLAQVQQYDSDTYETLRTMIDDAAPSGGRIADFRYATFGQVLTLKDSIDALWHLSYRSRQIEIDGKKFDREEVQQELAGRLRELGTPHALRGYDRAVSAKDKRALALLGARASLRRVESWADAVDAGSEQGSFRRFIWNPVSEATTAYRSQKRVALAHYLDIVKSVEKSLTTNPIKAQELHYTFTGKAELLGAILHNGNESNLDKLLRGRKWSPVMWEFFLDRMHKEGILTKEDYDYAQAVWDLFDTLKPGAQKAHRDMYGFYFSEITAHEVETPFGAYRGGYVPARVDPFIVTDASIRAEKEALEQGGNSFMFPTTGRGFTKSRIEQYARPLLLDLRLVPMHIDSVLRFTHIEPKVKDVARMLWSYDLRDALDGFDPAARGDMLVPWLQRSASQRVDIPGKMKWADNFARELRRRVGLQLMVANVTNALQQLTGLSISAIKVKPRNLRNGLWQYVRQPKQTAEQVTERSEFMRTRVNAQVHEIQSHIDDLLLNPTKYEEARAFAQKHGYFLQAGFQNVVDLVTWSGAYEEAVEAGENETESVRRADSAVRLTQGSFAPEDISAFEASTPVARLFSQFYSYFNGQANLLGSEFSTTIRELGLKKGAGRMVYVYVLGLMIPAVLAELIVKGFSGQPFDEDDDDNYLDDALALFFGAQRRYLTAMVPGVGPLVNAGFNAFNKKWYDDRISTSPAVSLLESAVRAPHSVYKAIADDGSRKQAARDLLTAVGLLTGLPTGALARPVGYLLDVEQGNTEPENALDAVRGVLSGR